MFCASSCSQGDGQLLLQASWCLKETVLAVALDDLRVRALTIGTHPLAPGDAEAVTWTPSVLVVVHCRQAPHLRGGTRINAKGEAGREQCRIHVR